MIKTYKEALDKIFTFEDNRDYSLDKVKNGMDLLGNPLKDIKVIHVAGTNGKGSVCKMTYIVLKEAGEKVGFFCSPHLVDIRERFVAESGMITEEEFVDILNEILELDLDFSYFEKCCLIAFLFFKRRNCKYAVVEVGVGGLHDSTNVVNPCITAITNISIDHTNLLGNTIEEISFQKAGIIKPNIPVVYNHKNKVIYDIANKNNSEIIFADKNINTNLLGEYQKINASIAYENCKYLGIPKKIILEGLMNVQHDGRLQYITDNLLIDGAHNIDAFKKLKKYLDTIENKFKNIYYCFSLKNGKDISLLIEVFGNNKNYILVDFENKMLGKISDLNVKMKDQNLDFQVFKPSEIYGLSKEYKRDLFVVFGSLYMIGEFLRI